MSKTHTQPLYGGAITIELPTDFIDVSQLREVPDNQEVFVNNSSNVATKNDSSIIVELMEMVEEKENTKALLEHVEEVTGINSSNTNDTSAAHQIQEVQVVDNVNSGDALLCVVSQKNVGKWSNNKEVVDELAIFVGLIRIPRFETDVLITINVPNMTSKNQQTEYQDILTCIIRSFKLVDESLFG